MKNDSYRHPYETPVDSSFDSDKNGELDGFESEWRDAYLDEMNRNTSNSDNRGCSPAGSDPLGCNTWLVIILVLFIIKVIFS